MSKIILILGSGSNIGTHVSRAFVSKGYKVALAARSLSETDNTSSEIHIKADFSDPKAIVGAFSKTKELLGIPSVVIYNAASATPNPPQDPLSPSLTLEAFEADLKINTTSAFVAAQQAALAFATLPTDTDAAKTFIYTGNVLNESVIAPLMTLGVGKSASAHLVRSAAEAYGGRGFKFYYADERNADGSPAYHHIDGEAHGKFYVELAEEKGQGAWQQTFVKGEGYKKFAVA
ncbi:hypothetical protein LCER1_G008053 [Lachnellula cervina]|uniref:Uncharacterized protein n=1 Tax=Lachnellula cervina TaxID=1316786 RepID=A0A7D8ULY0_9HELO|nr:hypothetical protein LCER1_G008053 [Lachnellula cervina]